jgi:hypothetical protein
MSYKISRPFLIFTVATPKNEYIKYPEIMPNADILSYIHRYSTDHQALRYYDYDNMAVLNVTTYDEWFKNTIDNKVRNAIRKAAKSGVQVINIIPDDNFWERVAGIFNETPNRRGRKYTHFGESMAEVKHNFSAFIEPDKNAYFGAYHKDRLIGYIHITKTDSYWVVSSIQAYIKDFDKAPMNALMSSMISYCEDHNIRNVVYGRMRDDGLGAFKKSNGFVKVELPRYYIPLTFKGKIALKLGFHHGLRGLLPANVKSFLKRVLSLYM